MQAVNSIRLVLGTVLDVSEDEDDVPPELLESPEYGLYGYLSFVLDARCGCSRRSATPRRSVGRRLIRPEGSRPTAANVSVLSTR